MMIKISGSFSPGIALMCLLLTMDCSSPLAQDTKSNLYNLSKGVAIQGYDPLSYFDSEKPLKGDERYTAQVHGVTYYFVSEANRNKFTSNPKAYEPEYGGWCAYAIGLDGSKVKIDPKTYKIIDGNLYLFYNFNLVNTLKKWNKKENELKDSADRFWAEMVALSQ